MSVKCAFERKGVLHMPTQKSLVVGLPPRNNLQMSYLSPNSSDLIKFDRSSSNAGRKWDFDRPCMKASAGVFNWNFAFLCPDICKGEVTTEVSHPRVFGCVRKGKGEIYSCVSLQLAGEKCSTMELILPRGAGGDNIMGRQPLTQNGS